MRVLIEAQLDAEAPPRQRARRVAKAVRKVRYWQVRRRQAERSHRKHALRLLRKRGVFISRLRKCDRVL